MGVSTNLYLSKRWSVSDIRDTIESHLNTKVHKTDSEHNIAPGYFVFHFKMEDRNRMMHVHSNSQCPIGPCTTLSFNSDEQGIRIMTTIAKVLGGIVEENDCDGKCVMYPGKLWDEDGLAYHLQYAVIHNQCDGKSLEQLRESVEKWEKSVKRTN